MTRDNIDRRDFVVLGTAAVAGLAAWPLDAQTLPGAGSAGQRVVSVGFVPRQPRRRLGGNLAPSEFVAAETVPVSEPSFIRTGARISLRGIRRPLEHQALPLTVHFNIYHHADGVAAKVPFYAWAFDASPRGINTSSPVSFNVPIQLEQTLDVAIAVRQPTRHEAQQVLAFTVGSVDSALKLNPGVYIFALTGDETPPEWRSLRGELEVGLLTYGPDGPPVNFDYLVMLVSHAPLPA